MRYIYWITLTASLFLKLYQNYNNAISGLKLYFSGRA